MFGKLREKLKETLSIFSKKTEEVAEEIPPEKVTEIPVERKKIQERKKEPVKETKKEEIKEEKKEKVQKQKTEIVTEEKEAVFIFHGWEDNSKSGFIPALRNYLQQNGYNSESFDQPDTKHPHFEKWLSFAEGKIEKVNKNNLSIVGHSMGGLLALKLAEKYKIKKLILVAPVGAKPSNDYFKLMGEKLSSEELQIFKEYQHRSLDIEKIKSNVDKIAFVFGLKDDWITEEIRDFYIDSFKDTAEIHLFEEYAHMSESEGVKRLPILEEFFKRKLKAGIFEHKKLEIEQEKKEIVKEEKIIEEPEQKKSFFGRIKESFSKKEEVEEKVELQKETKEQLEEKEEPLQEKKGFFGKIKESVTSKTISQEKFEELFWDLELVLLEHNVSVEVIEKIKSDLTTELVDKPLPWSVEKKIEETLKQTLTTILSIERKDLLVEIKQKSKKPFVIAFFGVNGAGKTTSIAKLTKYLQRHGHSVVLAACDTFRAAAIQQLEEHASRLNVKIIKHAYGADAAAVAFDAVKYAEKNGIEIVLIDTAGRLHSNTNLMAELEKIIRVTKPDMNIFVGESITGNDCIEQARTFSKLVQLDGVILTKADVDEKGGAPLSIAYTIKKPILFLGSGQKYEDLEEFNAEVIVKRLGF